MFVAHDNYGYVTPAEGIEMKPMAHGEKTLLVRFNISQGAKLPPHAHPHEQTGFLVSGHLTLSIGDAEYDVSPGGSWTVPGDVVHAAHALEDSVAIEVFSPVREDYLNR